MKKERQKLEPQSELEPWHKAGIFWPREWAKQRHTETGAETETEATEEEVANGFLSFSRSRFTAITRTVWLVKGRECWPQQTIWQLPELANWGIERPCKLPDEPSASSPAVAVWSSKLRKSVSVCLSLFSLFLHFLLF